MLCYFTKIAVRFYTVPIGDKMVICDKSGKIFTQHSFDDIF